MREIGGYIELDEFQGKEYHQEAIALNCGRNCLAYLLEAKKIEKIYIPYFLCNSVKETCDKCSVSYEYYHIGKDFKPDMSVNIRQNEYIYIINYYGTLSDRDIQEYKARWKNIIVDNTQDFFRMPIEGIDTLYTCRKYFGVSDGAYLYTDSILERELEQDISMDRIHYILGRYEKGANAYYADAVKNNASFQDEQIKKMSKLTHNLLRAVDYVEVLNKRRENIEYLNQRLGKINELSIQKFEGNFMYPLLISNGVHIRKKLQQKKIYIPTLWPDVFEICENKSMEYRFAEDILPIPIDQRYDLEDMEYMCGLILECINEKK